ncbi:MAG TPA: ThiF family adenylyltransferase [Hanamia sp.]|nr:ThiF family adenylyltransferase [Hanamia sp.]
MRQQLINHSPDLAKLSDEGFDIEIIGGHLLVHQLPYVTINCEIKYGTIVTVLNFATPDKVGRPPDHTVYFCGETPCDHTGAPLTAIINNSNEVKLTESITANHYFSSKPKCGYYQDYYEKINTYSEILASQARKLDANISNKPGQLRKIFSGSDVFKYPDTNSAKAEIEYLNRKYRNKKIAIIGIGGTGSYILDLVSKTPVQEIHIYDGDVYETNNAFRAPGATPSEKFSETGELKKVEYFYQIYSALHTGIIPHNEYVTQQNIGEFADYDFVFISVDKNEVRFMLTTKLRELGVSFIDVGLGVNKIDDNLIGSIRLTIVTKDVNDHLSKRIGPEEVEENEYNSNIQIADLNCLNATLAVIKWKKHLGYYQDLKNEHNVLYFLNTNKLINEDFSA